MPTAMQRERAKSPTQCKASGYLRVLCGKKSFSVAGDGVQPFGGLVGNSDAVAVADELTRNCWDAFARHNHADQVQRIGGGERDGLASRLLFTGSTQGFDRDRQRELLA